MLVAPRQQLRHGAEGLHQHILRATRSAQTPERVTSRRLLRCQAALRGSKRALLPSVTTACLPSTSFRLLRGRCAANAQPREHQRNERAATLAQPRSPRLAAAPEVLEREFVLCAVVPAHAAATSRRGATGCAALATGELAGSRLRARGWLSTAAFRRRSAGSCGRRARAALMTQSAAGEGAALCRGARRPRARRVPSYEVPTQFSWRIGRLRAAPGHCAGTVVARRRARASWCVWLRHIINDNRCRTPP